MPFSFQNLTSGVTLACIAAVVLCNLLILLMIRAGVLDHPVARSSHTRPTPKGGGIGIVGAFILCLPPALYEAHASIRIVPAIMGLLVGMILLGTVSWLDDVRPFPARYKLMAQFVAAIAAAIGTGATLPELIPFVLAAVFITNALNFIDGINGLASGVMAISALVLASTGLMPVAFVLLAVCLLSFLPYNFPKARIFMGDVGSQPISLAIAWGGMTGFGTGSAVLVIALLSGVLWDVAFTLARRARAGDRLAQAHRGHLYQLAVRSGLPVPLVTCLYWGFALWGAAAFATGQIITMVLMIVLPQLVWTGYVCTQARTRVQDRW
ncbi:MAG: UDP-phosphate alpha N-acetylglucosaminyltransferase [Gluconobacter potus]|uniref:UDP-phosphate alpha N-acetylglucosaminyltransferase n=1 Tax=Gluconobacter potus TaxID=2724927 RepID=A0ABR9YL96_9PROT|nr:MULTISPECIES: UDP-phosphate alpha N-acetylglucosaminyltransferase [Gluconobacter]MBF0864708.1 UDP-phosphate alpha N-acetylglucosaminyltransferase [Gluconobacter sp. R71656]MBF0866898.1 UDP-phosphate alpha N-acetylglucosaminyltransferase [Gluconobacter sp. R75628]MBF0873225.1 UDP-phosphate alpha N-acetylglucosaminyltransferase [Gluconobacter sp. R75629]MBF0882574.1 UDP-phosphate alpha N-acetylglucosaminyltransferase [Gluconobacter potus]